MALVGARQAALFKAACMGAFGVFVLGKALWSLQGGIAPEPATMGTVGFAALAVNAGVALLLYRFRAGDANMRSVWICSRNDALGNVAVMLAALGVFGTGSAWPDLLVAGVMGVLALRGSWTVTGQARAGTQGIDDLTAVGARPPGPPPDGPHGPPIRTRHGFAKSHVFLPDAAKPSTARAAG